MHSTYLVKNGHSVGAILRDTRSGNPLLIRAEALIQGAVRAVCGQELPVINYTALPTSNRNYAIAIGTAGYMTQIFGLGKELATLGEEGFCLFPTSAAHAVVTVITGRTERAVYHGVVHCADFLLRERGQDLFIPAVRAKRFPAMKVRGAYVRACRDQSPERSADDWKGILDALAEDSVNCIYFQLAGVFRSERFPEALCRKQTSLSTEGVQGLIAHAHALGTEFYLGSGVFAGAGVDELAKTHPETAALPKGRGKGLCPSHPTSRQLMAEYLTEMYDTFPEADGMLLEIRDDHGESEISFLREFSQTLWRRHSRAKIVCTIGRSEHKGDAGLYRAVQSLSDPRFAWLVVGGNWELPGEKGQAKPLTHFSPNMIHWKQAYCASLDDLRQWIGRVAREGVLGCCAALDPEFAGDAAFTAAEAVPCAVTRLAYRELCWAPQLGLDRLREIIHERFFGADSSPDLTTALLFLFDLIREQGVKGAHVQKAAAATQLDRIEAILGRHPSEFRPKARRALPLLREALAGARQALCQSQSALEGVRGVTNPRGPRGRTS